MHLRTNFEIVLIGLMLVAQGLYGQGLTIHHVSGKSKVLPVGKELIIDANYQGAGKRARYEGQLLRSDIDGLKLTLENQTVYDMIGEECQQSQSQNYCTSAARPDHYIPYADVETITVVSKEREGLITTGALLMFASAISGLVIAPIWGLTQQEEVRFAQSSVGQMMIGSSIGFTAGLTLAIVGSSRKKKYNFSTRTGQREWRF